MPMDVPLTMPLNTFEPRAWCNPDVITLMPPFRIRDGARRR